MVEARRCSIVIVFQLRFKVAIRKAQMKQDGLKLNGTHQILVNVDGVNILGGSVHTKKENAEA
jgi:hypothetical protein